MSNDNDQHPHPPRAWDYMRAVERTNFKALDFDMKDKMIAHIIARGMEGGVCRHLSREALARGAELGIRMLDKRLKEMRGRIIDWDQRNSGGGRKHNEYRLLLDVLPEDTKDVGETPGAISEQPKRNSGEAQENSEPKPRRTLSQAQENSEKAQENSERSPGEPHGSSAQHKLEHNLEHNLQSSFSSTPTSNPRASALKATEEGQKENGKGPSKAPSLSAGSSGGQQPSKQQTETQIPQENSHESSSGPPATTDSAMLDGSSITLCSEVQVRAILDVAREAEMRDLPEAPSPDEARIAARNFLDLIPEAQEQNLAGTKQVVHSIRAIMDNPFMRKKRGKEPVCA